MIVKCPKCGAKYRLDPAKFAGKTAPKIKCKHCGEIFEVFANVLDWEGATPPAGAQQEKPQAPSSQPSAQSVTGNVIIATGNSDFAQMVKSTLEGIGLKTETITDGVEALYKILNEQPNLAVVDVELPRLYGFEVTELVRRNDPKKNIKLILIGSIYNKEAYKRSPEYLYGADHYIDRHTVGEKLPELVRELLPSSASAPAEQQPQPTAQASPKPAASEEFDISQLSPEDQEWVKKAQRKARLIAADIALYNEEAIKEGLKNGDVYERIAKDLKAGREHYEKTIPEHIRKLKDFLAEEIEKMLEQKRKELGL